MHVIHIFIRSETVNIYAYTHPKKKPKKNDTHFIMHISSRRFHEGNGTALIVTVNNQRREIVVEGVIPKEEAPEKVKVLIIHQLGDYDKKKKQKTKTNKHCQVSLV